MEPSPIDERGPRTTDAPADAWVAWLSRAPDHDLRPTEPAGGASPGGVLIMLALVGFWSAATAVAWSALA